MKCLRKDRQLVSRYQPRLIDKEQESLGAHYGASDLQTGPFSVPSITQEPPEHNVDRGDHGYH
jgi:hypothetical protein